MVCSTDWFLGDLTFDKVTFTYLDGFLAMSVQPFLFTTVRFHCLPNSWRNSLFTFTKSNSTCAGDKLELVSVTASIFSVADNKTRAWSYQEHLTIHMIFLVSLPLIPSTVWKLGPLSEIPESDGVVSLVRLRESKSSSAHNLKSERRQVFLDHLFNSVKHDCVRSSLFFRIGHLLQHTQHLFLVS